MRHRKPRGGTFRDGNATSWLRRAEGEGGAPAARGAELLHDGPTGAQPGACLGELGEVEHLLRALDEEDVLAPAAEARLDDAGEEVEHRLPVACERARPRARDAAAREQVRGQELVVAG